MNKNTGMYWLSVIVLLSILAIAMPVSAQPTADNFGVNNASGAQGTHVIVPVSIANTSNGPIYGIEFYITYNRSVINIIDATEVTKGTLTADWGILVNNSLTWGTKVDLAYGGMSTPLPDGSSGSVALLNFSVVGNLSEISNMNFSSIELSDGAGKVGTAPPKNGTFYATGTLFDTGPGTYPAISGIHIGTLTPNCDISVYTLYTYSCEGTGGHTEYVWIHGHEVNERASWNGYNDEYQNIDFENPFILREGEKYNYTIKTGSYPQIIHEHSKNVTGGEISCTKFTDANGEIYDDWIPAIGFV